MSGGSLDYFFYKLEEHAKDLGDKELNELVSDLAELFHDREWFLSGDTGEGDWNEARDKFKDKWFTEHGRQERIEKYLADFAEEVRQTFGMSKRYCKNCKHWSKVDGYKSHGRCKINTTYMMHPYDTCDKDSFEYADEDIPVFDIEETHENCTVQILRNSKTGEESVGWWENENHEDNA